MTRKKMVDGRVVDMAPEQAASRAEEEAAWELELKRRAAIKYQKDRQQAYPKMGDQMDHLFKFINANLSVLQTLGFDTTEAEAWAAKVDRVKGDHPKPRKGK